MLVCRALMNNMRDLLQTLHTETSLQADNTTLTRAQADEGKQQAMLLCSLRPGQACAADHHKTRPQLCIPELEQKTVIATHNYVIHALSCWPGSGRWQGFTGPAAASQQTETVCKH